jgi:DNA-binding GntR family transcriptional regulator
VISKPPPSRPARGGRRRGEGAAADPSATQRIVDSITDAIVERRLMPGTKLAEQKIADIFDCSRTLVRPSAEPLSRDRWSRWSRHDGAFVAQPIVEEAQQVFEVRAGWSRRWCASWPSASRPSRSPRCARPGRRIQRVQRTDVPGRTRLLGDFHHRAGRHARQRRADPAA